MQTARGFDRAMKIGLCILLSEAGLAAANDMQLGSSWVGAFISGSVSPEEKQVMAAQFVSIQGVSQKPAMLAQLVTKNLELSSCYELTNGSRRCAYWDPQFMNGRAMVLTNLNVDSVKRAADSGGTATWQMREGVCVSPWLLVQLLNTSPKIMRAQAGEPIGGTLDEGESMQYIFDEINSNWGHVRVSARTKDECVNAVQIQLSK